MRSLTPTLTRGALLAASGGESVAFDCLECDGGVYLGAGHPHCSKCGAPATPAVLFLMQAAQAVAERKTRAA